MFFVKKKNLIITSVLIITVLTFILCVGALASKPVKSTDVNHIKVVIDAGHGGIDGGVVGVNSGVKESQINLQVSKKLMGYFIGAGIDVVMTRSTDAGLYGLATQGRKKKDMLKRKEIIEQANPTLVISIHMNKYSVSTRRGAQVFYKGSDEESMELAKNIQSCLNEMPEATREYSALSGDYYILNCTNYVSVICECGFLSNPEDEALLLNEEYQSSIAYTIFKGTAEYLALNSFSYFQ